MLKNKRILLTIMAVAIVFLIPSICNATDTFTTKDGIVAKKVVQLNNKGSMDFEFSNINLSSEGNYVWAIGTTSSKDDLNKFYSLCDFSESKKTARLSLHVSEREILSVLRKTNKAWLYIKDTVNDKFIVDALKVDLTLPPYKAFGLTTWLDSYYLTGGNLSSVEQWGGTTYNIKNAYYKFVKITDEDTVNKYKQALMEDKDIDSVFSVSVSDIENVTGWYSCDRDNSYPFTKISENKLPKESGIYYLYLKAKDTDSKMIYGYKIYGVDNEAPIVSNIKVTEPMNGVYRTGTKVNIRVNFNEVITGTSVPTLKIRFGDSAERSLTNGTIKDNYIDYVYEIQESDKGQLKTVSYTGGNIKDAYNNNAILSCPIISGNTIKANVDGTQDTQIEKPDNSNSGDTNNNNQGITNKGEQPSSGTQTDKKEDNTQKDPTIKNDNKLPQTGTALLSLIAISLIVVAVISKVKNNQYKDI